MTWSQREDLNQIHYANMHTKFESNQINRLPSQINENSIKKQNLELIINDEKIDFNNYDLNKRNSSLEEVKSISFTHSQIKQNQTNSLLNKLLSVQNDEFENKRKFQHDEAIINEIENFDALDECIRINPIPTFESIFNFAAKKGKKRDPDHNKIECISDPYSKVSPTNGKNNNIIYFQPSFVKDSKVSTDFSTVSHKINCHF